MSTMVIELYDALIAAGAPEDKARSAAKALSEHETRLDKIESRLILVQWMVGFNLTVTCAVLWVLLRVGMGHP